MKYTIGEKKNGQVTIEFVLDAKDWEAEVEKAYQKHKGSYKKEGFRQGKVPRKILEQTYGEDVFYEDAFNDSFPAIYTDMLNKEKQLFPVDYPAVAVSKMGKDGVTFTATITLLPEVKLGAYSGIEIAKKSAKATDAEVKAELESLQEKQARYVEITDRPAQNGDLINLNYSGSVDGVKFDGGTAEDQELTLGSHSFIEGFEEQMVGMKIGEEKDLNVTFPTPYHSKDLEGKPAVFAVKLLGIRAKELPELNDEFASSVSEFETLKDLKADLKKHIEEHKAEHAEIEAENKLVEAVVNNAEVEVPQSMIDSQIDHTIQDMSQRLAYQGLRFEQYLEYMGTTMADFRKTREEDARRSVKTSLVLEEIIKAEGLKVTATDTKKKIKEIAEATKRNITDVEREVKDGGEDYLKNTILSEKVINRLKELNNIK
ncbi:MAG: trigger factor [Clostridia bacterium]|nr:trigger factor [Clostridia bacterium]